MIKYRPEIDGLRAVAVVPVVLYHAGFDGVAGGFLGVDVFFAISGYLITSIIVSENSRSTFSILNFYERRIRRIIPLLYFVILVSIAVAYLTLLPAHMNDFSESVVAVIFFVSNILFYKESGYFAVASELKPLLHTWTLAVEEQYYVLFPPFVALVWRFGIKWLICLLGVAAAASLLLAQWGAAAHPEAAFYLLPTRGWELLAGSLLAVIEFKYKCWKKNNFLSLVGLIMIFFSFIFLDATTPTPSFYTCIPVLGSVLVLMFAGRGTAAHKVLSNRAMVAIGLMSYGVYLWHQPIFVFARHVTQPDLTTGLKVILIVSVFAISYLTWRFLEKPFRNRQSVSRKQLLSFFAIFSVALLGFGIAGFKTSGFIGRYDAADQKLLLSTINSTNYTLGYFNSIRLRPFDEDLERKKVVLIGDSYGQDLANAINESSLRQKIQLSTYRISTRCGNLYLEEDFSRFIQPSHLNTCRSDGWYESPKLRSLLSDADEVWLASSWKAWQARLLPKSVARIRREFDVEVTVFGTKEFAQVDLRQFLKLSGAERRRDVTPVPLRVRKVNEIIDSGLQETRFVDVSELICPEFSCPTLTPDGGIVTFDGAHLTKSGAKYLGRLLETEIGK
ncbi:acyltransferase [Erythrobacter sp. SN021]|uniref:acyltransferase family protein n=1 Tax=Erythrobacter sp. SN021 TaxID=2912574 RepID=UPI001F1CC06B|nr:acyltransferase family protein [Erythrobacter sp. SN021]MCF8881614.1 acyltransferase [Erythrobacter sp. SN021]